MALYPLADTALPLSDRGLAYGDGLFETLRVAHGRIPLLADHLQRLQRGMQALDLQGELDPLSHQLQERARRCRHGLLKLLLVREGKQRGYTPQSQDAWFAMSQHPLPPLRKSLQIACAHMHLSSQPLLAGVKHLARLEQVLAAAEASKRGVDELWLGDGQGRLVEGIQSNVFLCMEGEVITPNLKRAGVAGTVRAWVLRTLLEQAIPCRVTDITLTEARQASAAFMTSAGLGIVPVQRVDEQELDTHHAWIEGLQAQWNALMGKDHT